MKRAARTDAVQPRIVEDLRDAGAKVAITSRLGDGHPDLLVCYHGKWTPIEVKTGNGQLTGAERAFWLRMGVEPIIARNSDEACKACGVEVT